MRYDLMNSDIHTVLDIRPSQTKRGDILLVTKQLESCPYGVSRQRVIPAGKYVVVDRKHFRGGYIVVENIG